MRYWLILSFALFSMTGCVKDKIDTPHTDNGSEYFPLRTGAYITYRVDSIVIDDGPGGILMDSVHFLLREEISGYDIHGADTLFIIKRWRKNDNDIHWKITDVWTARRNEAEAVRTEENLTFRKMVFPLKDGRRWIATSYIDPQTRITVGTENIQAFQDWQSEVEEYDIADQLVNFSFDAGTVAHIVLTDTDDGATKRYVMEKYVRGIGLVQRIDTILDSRCIPIGDFTPCIGKAWLEHAGKGYILYQEMIDHN